MSQTNQKGRYMLKKVEIPTCNTFSGVEYILRGAKKRRSSAMANARRMNAEVGVQNKLVAVKQVFNLLRSIDLVRLLRVIQKRTSVRFLFCLGYQRKRFVKKLFYAKIKAWAEPRRRSGRVGLRRHPAKVLCGAICTVGSNPTFSEFKDITQRLCLFCW